MERWSNNKPIRPVPKSIVGQITQEEWNSLPSYERYRISIKGTLEDQRHLGKNRKALPDELKGIITEEEFNKLNKYERYRLTHQTHIQKSKQIRREKKFSDLDTWDRYQLDKQLRSRFGISIEKYEELQRLQNNLCAICKEPEKITYNKEVRAGVFEKTVKRLSVDHEHETGNVRGLLCFDCNKRVHSFNGNAENWLRATLAYIVGER